MSRLGQDALKLAILGSMDNIRTLMMWAEQAPDLDETIHHTEEAYRLLGEVSDNLRALRDDPEPKLP